MILTWYGGRCVGVEERPRGGTPRGIVFFPETKTSRVRTLLEKAQVIVSSEKPPTGQTTAFSITGPGEYDVAGFAIRGVALNGGVRAYIVESGDLVFCFFSAPVANRLTDKELEAIGDAHILSMPVEKIGDVGALEEVVSAIEPRAVLPLAADPKVRSLLGKELGASGEAVPRFAVSAKELPEEGFRVIDLVMQ